MSKLITGYRLFTFGTKGNKSGAWLQPVNSGDGGEFPTLKDARKSAKDAVNEFDKDIFILKVVERVS
jgi:hypothetical protein